MQFPLLSNVLYDERKFTFSVCGSFYYVIMLTSEWHPGTAERKSSLKLKKKKSPFGFWEMYLSSFDFPPLWATYIMEV